MKYWKSIFFTLIFLFFSNDVRFLNAHSDVIYDNQKAAYINKLQTEIITILDNSNLTLEHSKQQILDKYLDQIDVEWNARMAIGKYWKEMNNDQQIEYVNEYVKFLAYTWLPKFHYKRNKHVRILVKNETIQLTDTDDNVVIHIKLPDSKIIEVMLRVRKFDDNTFKILNLNAEGIDIAMSYRMQFYQYIEEHGNNVQELMKYIKNKNNENIKNADFKLNIKIVKLRN